MQPIPEARGRSLRVAVVLIGLLLLLAVVALASHTGFGHTNTGTTTPAYVNWAMSVFLVVFVLMIPVAAWAYSMQIRAYKTTQRRTMQSRIVRSLAVLALILGLLGLRVYLHHHHALPAFHPFWEHMQRPPAHGRHGAGSQPYNPTFQWPVLWVTIAVFAVVATWYAWQRAHREPPVLHPLAPSLAEDVAVSIDDALEDLEAEPDARRAVIAAYARMERAFARSGLRREPSETPTEYLRRILLELTTRVDAVRRLTTLFEQARFSDHTIDAAMKRDAIESLRAIRDDLQTAS
jgi:uncharacterized membrane protein